jgi:hypothetical protein
MLICAAQDQEAAPQQHRGRDQHPVVGAEGEAAGVRHDQPDEADRAGAGDRAGSQQGRHEEQALAQCADADAQGAGAFRMQGDHVHRARAAQGVDERAAQHDPGQQPQRRAGEVADHPEHHAAQPAFRGDGQHQRDQRHAGRAQDHAGQQQHRGAPLGRHAAAHIAPREQVEQHRHRDRTAQRRGVDRGRGAHQQQGEQGADRGAGRDPQYIRVGQRVAQ